MSKADYIQPCASTDGDGDLKEFIQLYKNVLKEHASDVAHGEEMLSLGSKTSIVQDFEKFLSNPIQNMLDLKKQLDQNVTQIVSHLFSLFIKSQVRAGFIKSAFVKTRVGNPLYFGIVLSDDNFENREKILAFLSYYYTMEFADIIPVYFQFMTEDAKKSFTQVENLA